MNCIAYRRAQIAAHENARSEHKARTRRAVGKSNVHQRDVGKVNGSMRDSLGSQGGSGADLVTQVLDEGSRYMRASSSTMRTFMCRGFAAAELSPPPPNCRDEGGGGGP